MVVVNVMLPSGHQGVGGLSTSEYVSELLSGYRGKACKKYKYAHGEKWLHNCKCAAIMPHFMMWKHGIQITNSTGGHAYRNCCLDVQLKNSSFDYFTFWFSFQKKTVPLLQLQMYFDLEATNKQVLQVVSLNCSLQPNQSIVALNKVCNSLAEFSLHP